jgi:plastocyanin
MLRFARSVCLVGLVGGLAADCSSGAPPAPKAEEKKAAAPAPGADGKPVLVGKAPAATGGLPAVVILEPMEEQTFPPQQAPPVMDQISLTFTPPVLFARTGQPAQFRNSDEVLHNVRVRNDETKEPAFNVAIPTGAAYSYTFQTDGFYDVGCDIHPAMAAVIVSTTSPFTTLADQDGSFSLSGMPPGAYKLTVYADVRKIEQTVTVSAGRTELGSLNKE